MEREAKKTSDGFEIKHLRHIQIHCGGAVVTHSLWVQEVPGSIPSSGKGFYV